MLYLIYIWARKMVLKINPYIASTEVSVAHLTAEKRIGELNQIHYAILDHKDRYYSLAEVSRYINIKVVHQVKTYDDNGKEHKKNSEFAMKDCDETDFVASKDEENYYKNEIIGEAAKSLCLPPEVRDMTIKGNIQTAKTYRTENSFLSIQIHRCGYNYKGVVAGADCESPAEITKWLENKQLEPLAFNNQPTLKNYSEVARVQFLQFSAVPFKEGIKSDLWFRFRENIFSRKDQWYYPVLEKATFSQIRLDYSNWVQVPKSDPAWEAQRIARLLYRNDEIQMLHDREVNQLEDFLGSIAGVYDLLMYFIFFVFGSYIDFLSRVKWIK